MAIHQAVHQAILIYECSFLYQIKLLIVQISVPLADPSPHVSLPLPLLMLEIEQQ